MKRLASSWRSLKASDQAAASSRRGRRSTSSGRQAVEPLQHRALAAAGHQRFVETALGEVVGGLATPRRERVQGGRLEQPARRQRLAGARVQRRLLVRRQEREAAPQLVARERMHAHPVAAFVGGEDRRVARQPGQPLAGVVGVCDRRAQLGMQQVEDRDPGQEGDVGAHRGWPAAG